MTGREPPSVLGTVQFVITWTTLLALACKFIWEEKEKERKKAEGGDAGNDDT